jgi:hypothetical protein
MARTTRVSNPVRSPSFRPSQSDPSLLDAFATGGPQRILAFYRSPLNTSNVFRSLVLQSYLQSEQLSCPISQIIYKTCYGRFRPNNSGSHLWRWCYRGGWHQSFPPLIRQAILTWQKPIQCISTLSSPITLSCIVKVSRLLHPVGLGPVSQCPSPGTLFQGPYGSKAW